MPSRFFPAVASSPSSVALILIGLLSTAVPCVGQSGQESPSRPIDFTLEIRPLLSDRCFACHGPDEEARQAELRLDLRDEAIGSPDGSVIVAGQPDSSELIARIFSDDPDIRMPPPNSRPPLSEKEKKLLRDWIQQGATWGEHWSFQSLQPVEVPAVDSEWPSNPIDNFVLRSLQARGIQPAPRAGKERLIRRAALAITGLPPTADEVGKFLADDSDQAFATAVERLLRSPSYGERMAVDWLDAARYADTYGYQSDVYREVWPWRDWVIDAFNRNLPYDKFVTWQLAGDLLPNATQEQILATAMNRLHRQTNEGGSVEEEFRAEYVSDRVNTFGMVFLGLTMECARCHDHKYDPIRQREYYELSAFFNNIDESGLYSHFTNATPTPTLLMTTEEQDHGLQELQQAVIDAERNLSELLASTPLTDSDWILAEAAATGQLPDIAGRFDFDSLTGNSVPNLADEAAGGTLSDAPQIVEGHSGNALKFSGDNGFSTTAGGGFDRHDPFTVAVRIKAAETAGRAVVFHRSRAWTDAGSRGYQLLIENGRLSASLIHFWPGNAIRVIANDDLPLDRWVHVAITWDGSGVADGLSIHVDGRKIETTTVRDKLTRTITGGGASDLALASRFRDRGFKNGSIDDLVVASRRLSDIEIRELNNPGSLLKAMQAEDRDSSRELRQFVLSAVSQPWRDAVASLRDRRRALNQFQDGIREIMVMKELEQRRPTHILTRGAYDAPGEEVSAMTPRFLPAMPADAPANRLGLARWLTDEQHPLTARVAVNRVWQSYFGRGLVVTSEDFGSQGALPLHKDLLDWLAAEFIRSGWDTRHLVRLIVTSSTWQQNSSASAELRTRDPNNDWLGRGPMFQLPAEMIRDQALFASGLLVNRIGGAPVKPYQPEGLWKEKSGQTYNRDPGDGSHRRSLYTYWKRTSPPPSMMTLDAAKRDVCLVRRQRTTTPLQALVLLNDPQYVEAARSMADLTLSTDGADEDRIGAMFQRVLVRAPSSAELAMLSGLLNDQRNVFSEDPAATSAFLQIGDYQPASGADETELAAWTIVAHTLLNLDETMTLR